MQSLTEDEIPPCDLSVEDLLLQRVVCKIGFGKDAFLPEISLNSGSVLLLLSVDEERGQMMELKYTDLGSHSRKEQQPG